MRTERLPPAPGLRERMHLLAARLHGHPGADMRLIGVTGTNGKTSVADFVAQGMLLDDCPSAVIGTLGWGVPGALRVTSHTTPDALSLWRQLAVLRDEGCRCVAMEVSSHALDQNRVAGLEFDTAVLTNLSQDHLDYHGSMDRYADAKARLFRWPNLQWAVLNTDDAFGREMLTHQQARHLACYGLDPAAMPDKADLRVVGKILRMDESGTRLSVTAAGYEAQLQLPLLGRHNVSNALAALAVWLTQGMPVARAARMLGRLRPVSGRLQSLRRPGRPHLVVDYAHTPDALGQTLATLRSICDGRIFCVFGCGGDRDRSKRPLMGRVAAQGAQRVIITDDNPRTERPEEIARQILAGIQDQGRVTVCHDRRDAIRLAVTEATADDLVLVAGKGHETTQQIGTRLVPFSDVAVIDEILQAT
jgi:UDP-N-acetylmuramoyl-L-alanyl-D-glutamate--2,6-diaminopimelate ligase